MSRRAQVLGGVLVVAGLSTATFAWRQESARADAAAVSTAQSPQTPALGTPALSMRRAPQFLVAPQAIRRLENNVGPTLGQLPATTCYEVRDANRTIVAQESATAFAPASNQKLLTGWATLDVFGPDHTFTTRFAATAAPVGGVINGDLWVIGGGDPLIDSDIYQGSQRWGRGPHTSIEGIGDQLVAAGITQITGSVIGDDSYFDDQRIVASWPSRYISQGQVGPLSALAVNDSRTYTVVAGQSSSAVPASNPPQWAAEAFTQVFSARGIVIGGAPSAGVAPSALTTVMEVASLPTSQLVAQMLTFSDNNTAELLIKAIGKEVSGVGSTEAGLAAASERLATLDVDTSSLDMWDGSGLDTENRVTCSILQSVLNAEGPGDVIDQGLPVGAGDVGTLKERFRRSPAGGNVRAKTGTLRSVTALSGWVTTDKGVPLSFSTIVNTGDREVTGADLSTEDKLVDQLLGYPDSIDPGLVGPVAIGQ